MNSTKEAFKVRWEHHEKKRYYQIYLSCDLLGDWVVTKSYGGLNNTNGKYSHIACSSLEDAKKLMEQIGKVRVRRGYIFCSPDRDK